MPEYIFICEDCDGCFSKIMPMKKIEGHRPQCKHCKSKNVYRDYCGESVSVSEGIKTVGALADRNADKMSDDQKKEIDSRTRAE